MSTTFPVSPNAIAGGPDAEPVVPRSDPPVDPELIQQTKNQIRGIVNEIGQLSHADLPIDEYYDAFLTRVVSALASAGGAIWTLDDAGSLRLEYSINLPRGSLVENPEQQTRHALLLKKILADGRPTLVQPHSGPPDDEEAGNPTEFLLVVGLLRVEQQTHGILEIFQRPGGGPTTQRGYLRFLSQMCELAGGYLTNRRLRHFSDRQTLWEKLEQFLRLVYRGLDLRKTAYTIANEGRRLIQADRVSVAVRRGERYEILAVSGLDSIDRRAEQIARLERLTAAVAKAGQPLWHHGERSDLPPQIEDSLQAYLDQSQARRIVVWPLVPPQDEPVDRFRPRPEPIGGLIVEQLQGSRTTDGFSGRVEAVAWHSASALANAREHDGLFLMPLWRAIGRAKWSQWLTKTTVAIGAVGLLVLAAILIPADFDLGARGKLLPSVRHEVFAPQDGVVEQVLVKHGDAVDEDQLLARLRNTDLDTQIAELVGRRATTRERIQATNRALLNGSRVSAEEQNRLSGELLELNQTLDGIDQQLELLKQKLARLEIRSPGRGQITTWQVAESLLQRPVQRGQVLLSVAKPDGPWELELYLPERRMGHVPPDVELPVRFVLTSHPNREFTGRVVDIHRTAEVRGEEGNTVLLRVAIDPQQPSGPLPELRSETTVVGRVHCGERSLGFVWLHELFETVWAKVVFWL